ncbi:winged helix-turn-helix domain-containing protein [Lederbergia wuyishanensis]|uniref:DNA-binding response OmpR family regulator n=1 Tax=Lederbergia wuyishanensis TaxID=1347903 RepID=A0ABU0D980_9BACI|nr:response regulator transcription factor [Lederbergia wuyishanensis]MCJ8009404.1 response regulator transcription factor [Lederbergia wuyishanensis]MDQ0344987.1 DNA-binding response OmpR family regulator [Lederbergia wuyishanensis]
MKILIVESEASCRDVLKSHFLKEGWGVMTSNEGTDALQKLRKFKVDLVILNPMVQKFSYSEICSEIRKISNVPLFIISSRSKEEDIINGFKQGADDYIVKPFRINEVIARIYASFRRIELYKNESQKVFCFNQNSLVINFETQEVLVDNKTVKLTSTEFKILDAFVKKPGKVFSRHDLSYIVQGYRYIGDARTMDAHIKNLRKKIEEDPKNPKYIVTKIGAGYKFDCLMDQAQ